MPHKGEPAAGASIFVKGRPAAARPSVPDERSSPRCNAGEKPRKAEEKGGGRDLFVAAK